MGNINKQPYCRFKAGDRVVLTRVGEYWSSKFKDLLNKSFPVLKEVGQDLMVDGHEYFPWEAKPYRLWINKYWFKRDEKNKQLTFIFKD